MQRRFFLKAVAALSTVPLIKVPDFRLIEPPTILLPNEDWFATAREISVYDIYRDETQYRWDIFDGDQQFTVGAPVRNPEALASARQAAAAMLADAMRQAGIDARSLKPLPLWS